MPLNFFFAIILSTIISATITPLIRHFFVSRGWVEDPIKKQQKTHNSTATSASPRGGGVPIFCAVCLTSIVFLPTDQHLLGILGASILVLLVGLWDDIVDISPVFRLFTNFLAASVVVGCGIGIAYISNPFGGVIDLSWPRINFDFFGPHSIWLISDLLAIFWIVACMNFVGWSSGVEGQLSGFVSISAIFIGILGLRYSADISQWPVVILAGAVAGAYLGFLPFNLPPQKIMPGYSGKSLAGFFLAVLAILSGAKLATVILLLGVPIIDAVFVLIKRIVSGRFPLSGGPDHLHHSLLSLGWSRIQISLFYSFISLSLGILSLFLNSQQKFYVFLGLVLLFVGFLLKVSRRI